MVSSSGLESRAHLEHRSEKKYRISIYGAILIEFETEGSVYELLRAQMPGG